MWVHDSRREIKLLTQLLDEIRGLRSDLRKYNSGKMQINWSNQNKGDVKMPGKETDTQTISATEVETDGQGNPVTLDPTSVQWAIDDPTVATMTQNPDGSATFKALPPVPPAVNPRTANVTCTDTKTGVVGTDTLEVDDSPTQPGKMTLTFGTAS